MKKLFIILCAALCVLPAFAGNEKVVDKSGRQPKWVYSSGKDYIEAIWGIGFRLSVPQEKS